MGSSFPATVWTLHQAGEGTESGVGTNGILSLTNCVQPLGATLKLNGLEMISYSPFSDGVHTVDSTNSQFVFAFLRDSVALW